MRILKIRGENLNSLADLFTVDLTVEPLRSAGLFAITGETGAGKSTILDAMCLALYGTCPRLKEVGVDDTISDISGDRIKSTDPRSMMRTGAAFAWAEVEFTGQDGKNYLARWAVRRARGRDNGRLQPVERSLLDISENRVIEDQMLAVNARVAEAVGLSYDEFRRTVLLPQGEFDAFLQANTGKRAAILEKVTGTEIYRQISRRIYARNSEARNEVATLNARRGEHRTLSADERANIDLELKAAQAAAQAGQEKLNGLTATETRLQSVMALRARLEAAKRGVDLASENYAKGDSIRRRIHLYDQALQAKHRIEQSIAAEQNLKKASIKQARAEAELRLAESKQADTLAALKKTETLRDHIGQQIAVFEPIWEQASLLDDRLNLLEREKEDAQKEFARRDDEFRAADKHHRDISSQLEKLEETKVELSVIIEQKAPIGHFAARWPSTKELIRKRSIEQKNMAHLDGQIDDARNGRRAASNNLAAAEADIAAIEIKIAELSGDLDRIEASLAEQSAPNPAQKRDDLRLLHSAVSEIARLTAAQHKLQGEINQAEGAIVIMEADRGELAARGKALADRIASVRGVIADMEAPTLRLEAAASEAAAALRSHLHAGEPCPVCASKEHPLLADESFTKLAQDMRERLDHRKAELTALEKEAKEADAALASVEAKLEQLQVKVTSCVVNIEASTKAIDEAIRSCLNIPGADQLAGIGSSPFDFAGALQSLHDGIEICAKQIASEHSLASQRANIQAEISATRGKLEREQKRRTEALLAVANQQATVEKYESEAATLRSRITEIEGEITPVLSLIKKGLSDLDQADMIQKLETAVVWWEDKVGRLEASRKQHAELAPQLALASSDLDRKMAERERAMAQKDERLSIWNDAKIERAGLLSGKTAKAHREEWLERSRLVMEALDRNQKALSQSALDLSKAEASVSTANCELARLDAELQEISVSLQGQLVMLGITFEQAMEGLRENEVAMEALRAGQQGLLQELNRAKNVRSEREDALAAIPPESIPALTIEEVQSLILMARADMKVANEEIGALQNRLAMDESARANLSDLDQVIDKATYQLETWEAVNAAVGQENGNKFAQFAQSVTLGILVERANMHLRRFNPRYHLEHGGEDLSIQVVDNHMAGERRSTNSISGGERFLVSLSLALALSGLGGNGGLAGTIFIDEGFGSLDAESLEIAFRALEQLQSEGRTVGIISHVEAMKEHITVKVDVRKLAGGKSKIRILA